MGRSILFTNPSYTSAIVRIQRRRVVAFVAGELFIGAAIVFAEIRLFEGYL
jgi:hypothetical protein